jgi:hypothetical protein
MGYAILLDGERVAHMSSDDAVRSRSTAKITRRTILQLCISRFSNAARLRGSRAASSSTGSGSAS